MNLYPCVFSAQGFLFHLSKRRCIMRRILFNWQTVMALRALTFPFASAQSVYAFCGRRDLLAARSLPIHAGVLTVKPDAHRARDSVPSGRQSALNPPSPSVLFEESLTKYFISRIGGILWASLEWFLTPLPAWSIWRAAATPTASTKNYWNTATPTATPS